MEIDKRLKEYYDKSFNVDAGTSMDAMIRIFIDACGISARERSMAFCASNYWRCRLIDEDERVS